ncbi:MAG: PspC domain-containing protein [Acidimicrobiales bacterium]
MSRSSARTFTRQRQGRLLGGVCAGLARVTHIDVSVVRLAALLLCLPAGVGLALYGLAWLLVPNADHDAPEPAPSHRTDNAGVLIAVVGAVIFLRGIGVWFSDGAALIGAVAALGIVLVWGHTDTDSALRRDRLAPLRIAVGVVLVGAGIFALFALTSDLRTLGRTLFGAVVAVAGIGLLAGPYVARLVNELAAERRARIRSEEKAELASHLHDGVLQTLALIQHRAGDNRDVAALARRQERQLRQWLYSAQPAVTAQLAGTLRTELGLVEDDLGVRIELVCVGDAELDDAGRALVAAAKEAAVNAARHAEVDTVDVYVEVEAERVTAFVRDRGRGFDPESVPTDRRGLADSVLGRIRRVGGTASVRSQASEGTEITLSVPRKAR